MNLFRTLYINSLFFKLLGSCTVVFIAGYFVPPYFFVGQLFLAVLSGLLLIDIVLLYTRSWKITIHRKVPYQCSLGHEHKIILIIRNENEAPLYLSIIDDAPEQLEIRDEHLHLYLGAGEEGEVSYTIKPAERGVYEFGNHNVFINSILRLATRKHVIPAKEEIAVYPSVILMKQYELKVFSKVSLVEGIKQVRRLGHSNDFEQIRNYVQGDDFRKINWKATSRNNELMVNQYEDEKAQQVYCIVDKSRAMQSTFNQLSLLDHAINSTLVFSNIAIRKSDRAGLITFSDKIGSTLQAERSMTQLKKIMEILYRQKTKFAESNYELLFSHIKKTIKGRSLLMLFTNFESSYALQRRLVTLRNLNKQHLLVVIFFEDNELKEVPMQDSKTVRDIYFKTVAGKLEMEKHQMVLELRKYGIQSILTTPEKLSADTINKYLEIKSRGMI